MGGGRAAPRPDRKPPGESACSTPRRDAHLHHLLFSKSSHTLLLSHGAAAADGDVANVFGAAGDVAQADLVSRVFGGATFRLSQMGGELVLTVLVLAVQQREGVCRRGHGTRLVDALGHRAKERAPSWR